jgi:hypothetical protein
VVVLALDGSRSATGLATKAGATIDSLDATAPDEA